MGLPNSSGRWSIKVVAIFVQTAAWIPIHTMLFRTTTRQWAMQDGYCHGCPICNAPHARGNCRKVRPDSLLRHFSLSHSLLSLLTPIVVLSIHVVVAFLVAVMHISFLTLMERMRGLIMVNPCVVCITTLYAHAIFMVVCCIDGAFRCNLLWPWLWMSSIDPEFTDYATVVGQILQVWHTLYVLPIIIQELR